MQDIKLNPDYMKNLDQTHTYLAKVFHFPGYYGKNLDALHDLLSEIHTDLEIHLPSSIKEKSYLGQDGQAILQVFQDAAADNKHIKLIIT